MPNIFRQRSPHSISVEVHFLSEDSFASLDSRREIFKNPTISVSPDRPHHGDDCLHGPWLRQLPSHLFNC
jgi:hypothetical protein